MKKMFNDVLERLKANVKQLKYIDENWGQLDYYSPNPPVKFPCALIDLEQIQWSDMGNLAQISAAQIRVVVADLKLVNTSGGAPVEQRQKVFEFYDLLKDVFVCLHGYKEIPAKGQKPTYGTFTRSGCRRVRRDDGFKMYELTFIVQMNDLEASPVNHKMKLSVKINTDKQ